MAGAGPAFTAQAGPLVQQLPAVAPYRRGQSDDVRAGVFYRADAVSVRLRVEHPRRGRHRADRRYRPRAARATPPRTAAPSRTNACAASPTGMRVAFFDARGAFDLGTVTRWPATR